MRDLTIGEKRIFEKWIISNVTASVVPADEGSDKGLIYNLVHLLRGSSRRYNYLRDQDVEIQAWKREVKETE